MLSNVLRAADSGRRHAFVVTLGVCAISAVALGSASPRQADLSPSPAIDRPRIALAIVDPVDLAGDARVPDELIAPLAVVVAPVDASPPADETEPRQLHGRFSHAYAPPARRAVSPVRADRAEQLAQVFQRHDYSLDQTRSGQPVPALQIDRVPGDLGAVKDGNERKAMFIKALLPIVLEVNERIHADRQEMLRLRDKQRLRHALSAAESGWLVELAERYGAEPANFVELVARIDVVPPSMAIAQAGVESGWGTSYAARVGNSLFGQIQAGGRHSVAVPWRAGPAMPQPFQTVADSVEAYFLNLNTHPAYDAFRAERGQARAAGKHPDGYQLIGNLRRYSELGQQYIDYVRGIIRENKLTDFDNARLTPI